MITPRRTRLVRVRDLRAFRRAVRTLSTEGNASSSPPALVVVPTRGAALILGKAIPAEAVTRDELYEQLAARLPNPPRRLSAFERDAMFRAAARHAIAEGVAPPFRLRPGLVAEIGRFYDQLRRQRQAVDRFEQILTESLERDVDLDRGAARMLDQTRFLAAVYRAYDTRLAGQPFVDEHALRELLIRTSAAEPVRHLIITVADWIAEDAGLHRADFDLLTRLPDLESIDVIATAAVLASGFEARLLEWLPGIEIVDDPAADDALPAILTSPANPDRPLLVYRDREEELIAIADRVREAGNSERTAVVFKRPLPYLYLARQVCGGAGVPYQTSDTLPLAAEPATAALDLMLEFASSRFTRRAIVALLRSPHVALDPSLAAIARIDRGLSELRYLGELDRLREVAGKFTDHDTASLLESVIRLAEGLQPLLERAPASIQMTRLIEFVEQFRRPPTSGRDRRGHAAIVAILESLRSSYAAYDDAQVTIDELAPDVRRWVEEATFAPETDGAGVHLVDAQAARYGDFDHVTVVGLVESEWPERVRPNIFYPPALLATLGWPAEHDRRAAETASFDDLLTSARRTIALSSFTLDDETMVEPSSLVDEIDAGRLTTLPLEPLDRPRARSIDPDSRSLGWQELRAGRTDAVDPRFHGQAGAAPSRPWSVSAIETYLTCPFKFFAQHVLALDEEPEDDEVMDPRKQGQFVHHVFEQFFKQWQQRGHRAITAANLDAARALFADVAGQQVARLPEAEAALERTRLLGSPVAPGLAEIVFRMEAERPDEVVERLLEFPLRGEFEFVGEGGAVRKIPLKGIADRLDLLADGTFRLIDYKLSTAPQKSRALQLPIYGLCAEQRLQSHNGRGWTLGDAAYIAFRGARRVVPLFTARGDRDEVLGAAQRRLITAVDGIERGEFPPTPEDVFLCGFCSFASVCRKDYVGDV